MPNDDNIGGEYYDATSSSSGGSQGGSSGGSTGGSSGGASSGGISGGRGVDSSRYTPGEQRGTHNRRSYYPRQDYNQAQQHQVIVVPNGSTNSSNELSQCLHHWEVLAMVTDRLAMEARGISTRS